MYLCPALTLKKVFCDFPGRDTLIYDLIHAEDYWQLYVILFCKAQSRRKRVDAFNYHADFGYSFLGCISFAQKMAAAVVSAVNTRGGNDKVAHARKAVDGLM